MPAPSQSRHRGGGLAVSELYSALVLVVITVAASYLVYSFARFPDTAHPVYTVSSYAIYGSPSFLHLEIRSSSPSSPLELRLDATSSSSGVLELTASGYSSTDQLCAPGATTFFAVQAGPGTLSIAGAGTSWIDGVSGPSAVVTPGWHELVVANGSDCTVTLPDGRRASYPSASLSTIPMLSLLPQSFVFLIPYRVTGHVVTVVFEGGVEVTGF